MYQTDSRMYKIPIEFEIKSSDDPMKIHFNKIVTSRGIKLIPSDGEAVEFS